MNCAEAEILICDYLDEALAPAARAELEGHLAGCPGCRELARDASAAMAFMERAAAVEPPAELVTRILFDPPWAQGRARAAAGLRSRLRGFFQPVFQPRFAMGMAMTILSFAMLARFVKPVRQLSPRDLDPAVVWASVDDHVYRAWQRTVKFYESIRVVYQIQSTVREWQQQGETAGEAEPPETRTDERRLPLKTAPAPGPGAAEKTNP
jgi:hypothetical protein